MSLVYTSPDPEGDDQVGVPVFGCSWGVGRRKAVEAEVCGPKPFEPPRAATFGVPTLVGEEELLDVVGVCEKCSGVMQTNPDVPTCGTCGGPLKFGDHTLRNALVRYGHMSDDDLMRDAGACDMAAQRARESGEQGRADELHIAARRCFLVHKHRGEFSIWNGVVVRARQEQRCWRCDRPVLLGDLAYWKYTVPWGNRVVHASDEVCFPPMNIWQRLRTNPYA